MKQIARILPFLFCLLLFGCRTVKYVPVESIRLDTMYVSKIYRDSIKEKDSILVVLKGDTIFRDRYKIIDRWSVRTDTFWRVRIDTAQVPYPIEAQLTGWQKFKINVGEVLIGMVITLLAAFLFYLVEMRK